MKITELPEEMLVEILTYIPVERRKCASWKIKSFYEASKHPRFKRDFRLNFRAAHLDESTDPVRVFEGNKRIFDEVVFYDTTFGDGYEDFVQGICKFAETITIKCKHRWVKTKFFAIFEECGQLKNLSIILRCYISILYTDDDTKNKIKKGLATVENLTISGYFHHFEDRVEGFVEFLELMPHLKTIDLRGLKFGLNEKHFHELFLSYIERHSSTLQGILFPKNDNDMSKNLETYKKLMQMKDLSLNSFSGAALEHLAENDIFRQFLQTKCHLEELRVNEAHRLQWILLRDTIKEQDHLKRLEIDSFPFISAVEAGLLNSLPEIESIIIRKDKCYNQRLIVDPLGNEENRLPVVNRTLKELIVCQDSCVVPLFRCDFQALVRLVIHGYYGCQLKDEHVHLLCEKLPQLTDFTITSTKITEFAITGRPRQKFQPPEAKTKSAVVDLKNLQKLALEDVSISSHAFTDLKLNSLHSLSLEGCFRLNHAGIVNIVQNCPNIENLNVSYCVRLKSASIVVICESLVKLRRLKINNLPSITSYAFEKMGKSAHNLRYLHMRYLYHLGHRKELAVTLFNQLPMLRMVQLGIRSEINHVIFRKDIVEDNI